MVRKVLAPTWLHGQSFISRPKLAILSLISLSFSFIDAEYLPSSFFFFFFSYV
ncbi:hypothetical protein Pint_23914 [Pistacia integerrima]|uniref:Uncharacterized protein n=1 Tax=Pistacia integerrima TaxID=434235 RepID=A0ACC0YJ39_9ROSI|nr:hypothetical protein Pint_23914 [Pistacia integerrima]